MVPGPDTTRGTQTSGRHTQKYRVGVFLSLDTSKETLGTKPLSNVQITTDHPRCLDRSRGPRTRSTISLYVFSSCIHDQTHTQRRPVRTGENNGLTETPSRDRRKYGHKIETLFTEPFLRRETIHLLKRNKVAVISLVEHGGITLARARYPRQTHRPKSHKTSVPALCLTR